MEFRFTARMYDGQGNEVHLKPGHVALIGENVVAQVPVNGESAELIYRPPGVFCEYGTCAPVTFITSQDSYVVNMEDSDEEGYENGDSGDDRQVD